MPDRPRCVAADADPAVNRLLAVVLARAGFEVGHLAGAWEAAAADLGGVALVVLGGRGHGVSAADAAPALRAAGGRTPVVILVNRPDPAAAALAAADPAVRLVEKPFLPADLTAVVADLLGG
jgi:DNA-binding NtrC family response regulator